MLGKASEMKSMLVLELAGTNFDETLNKELEILQECSIIDIQFKATTDNDGQAWFSALIIYKEAESNVKS